MTVGGAADVSTPSGSVIVARTTTDCGPFVTSTTAGSIASAPNVGPPVGGGGGGAGTVVVVELTVEEVVDELELVDVIGEVLEVDDVELDVLDGELELAGCVATVDVLEDGTVSVLITLVA